MKSEKITKRDLYYTIDHEWVDFQGSVAYTGVCKFKLSGFKVIEAMTIDGPLGFKKQGEVIATIRNNDHEIIAHMPVDGKIVQVNDDLIQGKYDTFLAHPENNGWLALIVPSQPYERKGLMMPKDYLLFKKGKNAKR